MEVRVEGKAVKVEHRKGDFRGRDGEMIGYDFKLVRLLTDEFETVDVRFDPDGPVPLPAKGDVVHYTCDARVSGGAIVLRPQEQLPFTYAELAAANG